MAVLRLLIVAGISVVSHLSGETTGYTLPCTSSFFKCGSPAIQPDGQRIVGGQEAQRGAWPWTVLLLQGGYVVCGGAIIGDRFILTATHCFKDRSNDTSTWKVIAGKQRLDRYEHAQQSVGVSRIIYHENYNKDTLENDIAIVLLSESLSFSTLIAPICLPEEGKGVYTGQLCLMAGWGHTLGTSDQNTLNQIEVPIIGDDVCATDEWYGSAFHPEKTFCAGYEEGGKDACHGDSGGPLICREGDKWVVQGIASWGNYCAQYRWPGIYVEVTKYLTWVQGVMDRESKKLCEEIPIVG